MNSWDPWRHMKKGQRRRRSRCHWSKHSKQNSSSKMMPEETKQVTGVKEDQIEVEVEVKEEEVGNTNSIKKEISHFSQQENEEEEAFKIVQDTGDLFNVSIVRSVAISLPIVDILLLIVSTRMPILWKELMKMWSPFSY